MDSINKCFSSVTLLKVENKEGFSIYAAALASSLGNDAKPYVLAFVPEHLAIEQRASLSNLQWENVQTRFLVTGYRLPDGRPIPQQKWAIPKDVVNFMFNITAREPDKTRYVAEGGQLDLVLIHDKKKKTEYQYHNKINLIAALSTHRCVISHRTTGIPLTSVALRERASPSPSTPGGRWGNVPPPPPQDGGGSYSLASGKGQISTIPPSGGRGSSLPLTSSANPRARLGAIFGTELPSGTADARYPGPGAPQSKMMSTPTPFPNRETGYRLPSNVGRDVSGNANERSDRRGGYPEIIPGKISRRPVQIQNMNMWAGSRQSHPQPGADQSWPEGHSTASGVGVGRSQRATDTSGWSPAGDEEEVNGQYELI